VRGITSWAWLGVLILVLGCPTEDPDFNNGDDDDATGDDDTGDADDTGDDDTGDDDTGDDDTGDDDDSGPDGFTEGDPIETVHVADTQVGFWEWVDAALLDDGTPVVVGVSGFGVLDPDDHDVIFEQHMDRSFRVAADGDKIAVATREGAVKLFDLTNRTQPVPLGEYDAPGYHEDVAFDGDRVLVGWHDSGGVMLDASGNPLANLPGDDVFAVGLSGDRAVLTDDQDLVLYDVSQLPQFQELDRIDMSANGRDIDFDGDRIAVGLGGQGAAVFEVDGDSLVELGRVEPPGTALSVALDGDYLWIGGWEIVGLAWIGPDGPLMLGNEPPESSAMGLAAGDGVATVADWYFVTTMERGDMVAGSELVLPERLYFTGDPLDPLTLTVHNGGAFPLSVELEPPDSYAFDQTELDIAPGGFAYLLVTPDPYAPPESLEWTSNDPDEPSGTVELKPGSASLGTPHDDFTLEGFTWPDTTLTNHTLFEQQGKVVFLAYWANF